MNRYTNKIHPQTVFEVKEYAYFVKAKLAYIYNQMF